MSQPRRLSWRRVVILFFGSLCVLWLGFWAWRPGTQVTDGRHDRQTNGIWMQHGWLGADSWFSENDRDPKRFRSREAMQSLSEKLASHGIRDLFPHLCPCEVDGTIAAVDDTQTTMFLDVFAQFRVIPWIGGVHHEHCRPKSEKWRRAFVTSCVRLLDNHPRLAGVQVNIEPWPSGDLYCLTLLREIKAALPAGKILSIAAYPPPTRWHPFTEIHWDEAYFRQVAGLSDHMAVMTYDTALRWPKVYEKLMSDWTEEVISWAGSTPVMIGIPAYDDADSGYHHPDVENPFHALSGMHSGLLRFKTTPANYLGIALYSDWEMTDDEWQTVSHFFGSPR